MHHHGGTRTFQSLAIMANTAVFQFPGLIATIWCAEL